jgi:cytochrome c oxidase subunit 4
MEIAMEQTKGKELTALNMIQLLLAGGSLAVAVWAVASDGFKSGTDTLFLVMVCLLLGLVFSIGPLMWAAQQGWISNPFNEEKADEDEHAHGGSNRENAVIWIALLAMTGVEVLLAYVQLNVTLMLIILMGLSIIKAALIVSYFMHMKFERLSFILTVVPILVALLCLFAIFFPDGSRVNKLRSTHVPSLEEQQKLEK